MNTREEIEASAKQLVARLSGLDESKRELDIFTNDNNAVMVLKHTNADVLNHAYLLAARISNDNICVRVCALLIFCHAENVEAKAELQRKGDIEDKIENSVLIYALQPRELATKPSTTISEKPRGELAAALYDEYTEAAICGNMQKCALLHSMGVDNAVARKILSDNNELKAVEIIAKITPWIKDNNIVSSWVKGILDQLHQLNSLSLTAVLSLIDTATKRQHPKLKEIQSELKVVLESFIYSARYLANELSRQIKNHVSNPSSVHAIKILENALGHRDAKPIEILAAVCSACDAINSIDIFDDIDEHFKRVHPGFCLNDNAEYRTVQVYFLQNGFSIEMAIDEISDKYYCIFRNREKKVFVKHEVASFIETDMIAFDPLSGILLYSQQSTTKENNGVFTYDINKGASRCIYQDYLRCMIPLTQTHIVAYCHATRNIVMLDSTSTQYVVQEKVALQQNECVQSMSALGNDKLSCLISGNNVRTLQTYGLQSDVLVKIGHNVLEYSASAQERQNYLMPLNMNTMGIVSQLCHPIPGTYNMTVVDIDDRSKNISISKCQEDSPDMMQFIYDRDVQLTALLLDFLPAVLGVIVRQYLRTDDDSSNQPILSEQLAKIKSQVENNYSMCRVIALRTPYLHKVGLFSTRKLLTNTNVIIEDQSTTENEKLAKLRAALQETNTLLNEKNQENTWLGLQIKQMFDDLSQSDHGSELGLK